jgi:hypothetical protein
MSVFFTALFKNGYLLYLIRSILTIPPFHHSTIPPFHHSTIPPFHHSTISAFRPAHRETTARAPQLQPTTDIDQSKSKNFYLIAL